MEVLASSPAKVKYTNKSLSKYASIQIKMAILYHDVIYKIGSKNNEKESAEVFLYAYKDFVADSVLREVYDLILSTKKHYGISFPIIRKFW